MANEIANNQGVPDYLTQYGNAGTEEVEADISIPEVRVCTKMSRVFSDGNVDLGHLYNLDTGADLGEARQYVIFDIKKYHQCSNENHDTILCKSFDKKKGYIRGYNKEEFDKEFVEGMELTEEEAQADYIERDCVECPFHPSKWKEEDGNHIPPRCKYMHEYYVFDVTEGFNKSPFVIRVVNSSRFKNEFIKKVDNLINSNYGSYDIPVFSGVFNIFGTQKENSRGGKNYVLDIEFANMLHKYDFDFEKPTPGQMAKFAFKSQEELRSQFDRMQEKFAESTGGFSGGGTYEEETDEVWPGDA